MLYGCIQTVDLIGQKVFGFIQKIYINIVDFVKTYFVIRNTLIIIYLFYYLYIKK